MMIKIACVLIMVMLPGFAFAAKCKVDGRWYDYSSPQCSVQGTQQAVIDSAPKESTSAQVTKSGLKVFEEYKSDAEAICKATWTKRGVLNFDMYWHCFKEQDEAYTELVTLQRFDKEDFYSRISFPYCNVKWTKRGITDVRMLVYCLNQEVEGYEDIAYYRKQYNSELVDRITDKAIKQFGSWNMAAYKVKSYIESE